MSPMSLANKVLQEEHVLFLVRSDVNSQDASTMSDPKIEKHINEGLTRCAYLYTSKCSIICLRLLKDTQWLSLFLTLSGVLLGFHI